MRFIIADTFTDSLAQLGSRYQGPVKETVFDFQADPRNPGFRLHKLKGDKNFASVSVNMDVRIIIHREDDLTVLCYVDHHNPAYDWAERHQFSINDRTGAAQIIKTEKRIEEVVVREQKEPPLFGRYEDDYLLALGVPHEWLDAVKIADEDGFLNHLMESLPPEASERLSRLATGEPVPRPVVPEDRDPFAHPDARSRFLVVGQDTSVMQRALDAPWDKWVVFLHPSQREVVEKSYSGPARITGGAGTGKTVVALHRAARLAKQHPAAKILLTTFSKTLAARLEHNLALLLGDDAPERERIEVNHLHSVAMLLWQKKQERGFRPLMSSKDVSERVKEAATTVGETELSPEFLRAEWELIIDTEGVRDWERYRSISRAGRGTPVGARQRQQAWNVFEEMYNIIDRKHERTWQQACYDVAEDLAERDSLPYDHVIADEIQDFGPAELRLLRALVPEQDNDLFLTGDLGQRIYKGKTSFLAAGIDIRGRSNILSVNYRTTEQIRRHAEKLLPSVIADLDGKGEPRAAVSLLSGPEPTLAFEKGVDDEQGAAVTWLKTQLDNGYRPEDIAIFVRTNRLVDRAKKVAKQCDLSVHDLKDDDEAQPGCLSVGTMHRAKGLEFKVVMVLGCEDDTVPYRSVYNKQPDDAAKQTFIEQEQNLLYVACTRARERLFVSSAGEPSRFLSTSLS